MQLGAAAVRGWVARFRQSVVPRALTTNTAPGTIHTVLPSPGVSMLATPLKSNTSRIFSEASRCRAAGPAGDGAGDAACTAPRALLLRALLVALLVAILLPPAGAAVAGWAIGRHLMCLDSSSWWVDMASSRSSRAGSPSNRKVTSSVNASSAGSSVGSKKKSCLDSNAGSPGGRAVTQQFAVHSEQLSHWL